MYLEDDYLSMNFSGNLKRVMDERGLTVKTICEATGIPTSTLSDWLSGSSPRLNDHILKLTRFLGCSVDFLLTGSEPEKEIIESIVEEGSNFSEIHVGVYRVKIEKLIRKSNKD